MPNPWSNRRWSDCRPIGQLLMFVRLACLLPSKVPFQASLKSAFAGFVASAVWSLLRPVKNQFFQSVQIDLISRLSKTRAAEEQQLDSSEKFRKSDATKVRNARSKTPGVAIKKFAKPILEYIKTLGNVPNRLVTFRSCGAIEGPDGVIQALVDYGHPKKKIGQQYRIGTLLLRLSGLRRFRARAGPARLAFRDFRLRPHNGRDYGDKMSRALTDPWNSAMRPFTSGFDLRISSDWIAPAVSLKIASSVGGDLGTR
jgi:hypothetical protein